MGEVAVTVIKWSLRLVFMMAVLVAFVGVIMFGMTMVLNAQIGGGVIGDLMALIQMWLPFNLDVLITWLMLGTVLMFTFRLAEQGYNLLNKVLAN